MWAKIRPTDVEEKVYFDLYLIKPLYRDKETFNKSCSN